MNDDGTTIALQAVQVPAFQPDHLLHQRPIIKDGDASRPTPCWLTALHQKGDLALGENLLIAFMPWNGLYNCGGA